MALSHFRRRLSSFSLKSSPLSLALIVGVALLASGCHPKVTDPKDPKFIVAEKGDWNVTRGELDTQVNSYLQQSHMTAEQLGPEKMPLLESAMLDNIVLKKLLLDKAAAMQLNPADIAKEEAAQLDRLKGPMTDQQFADQLKAAGLTADELKKRIHEKVLISKVLDAEALKNVEPSDQEINDIYEKNKDRFVIPAKLRASRVLIHLGENPTPQEKAAAKKKIDLAHAQVVKGEDISKVAAAISEDRSSAPKGGDLGWFAKGENEPEFDVVAFATKEGVVSAVFETPLGFQFIKITGSQPAGVVPIADVRAFIAKKLRDMKAGEAQEAYSKKLLADSGVTFFLVRPPPPTPMGAPQDGAQGPEGSQAPAPDSAPAPTPHSGPVPAPDATAPASAPAAP